MKPLLFAILCVRLAGAPITITDIKGRSITAEVVSQTETSVVVKKTDGAQVTIALVNLSLKSKEDIKDALASNAATAGDAAGLKLSTVSNAAGKTTDKKWEMSWGSYDKEVFRSRAVVVTVVSDTPGNAVLEVHWIGSQAGRAGNRGIVLAEKEELVLKAREPVSLEFAALFVENDAKYVALGTRDRDGIKYAGWVVRVLGADGKTLAIRGSRPPLVEMVKNEPPVKDAE